MKNFALIALAATLAFTPAVAHKKADPSATKYCVWRVPGNMTVDYTPTKLMCDPDQNTVYAFYTGLRLALPDTVIVMIAPGGAPMYGMPSQ
jgi:hypothetical protein